MSTSIVKKV